MYRKIEMYNQYATLDFVFHYCSVGTWKDCLFYQLFVYHFEYKKLQIEVHLEAAIKILISTQNYFFS